jgi:hypothetical protein
VFTTPNERSDIDDNKFVKQAVVCMVSLGYPEDRTGCDILKGIYDLVDWYNEKKLQAENTNNK